MLYRNLILVADFDSNSNVDIYKVYDKWHFNDKYWAEISFYTTENYEKIVTIKSKDLIKVRRSMKTEYYRVRKIYKEGNYLNINNIWSNLWKNN